MNNFVAEKKKLVRARGGAPGGGGEGGAVCVQESVPGGGGEVERPWLQGVVVRWGGVWWCGCKVEPPCCLWLVGHVPVIDPRQPGEQDHPSVSEHLGVPIN